MVVACFRKDNDDVLGRELTLEMVGRSGRRRQEITWRRNVVKRVEKIGQKQIDATDRAMWRNCLYKLSRNTR